MKLQENKKLSFFLSIGVILVLSILTIFQLNNNDQKEVSVPKQADRRTVLDKDLSTGVVLNKKDLKNSRQWKLWNNNIKNMTKAQFYGAYVGVKNSQLMFSGQNGFANARTKSLFKTTSVISIGKLQLFLNDVMVFSLVSQKKINLKNSIQQYLPKLDIESKTSVADFLKNGTGLYIKDTDIRKFGTVKDDKFDWSLLKKSKINDNYVSADAVIKVALIACSQGIGYRNEVNALLVQAGDLFNTRISAGTKQANDVLGYRYLKRNKLLLQQKSFPETMSILEKADFKMSISDILITLNNVFNNKYFGSKYNNLFHKVINTESSSNYKRGKYTFSSKKDGQYVELSVWGKGSQMVFVTTNFPNKKMSAGDAMNAFIAILNQDLKVES